MRRGLVPTASALLLLGLLLGCGAQPDGVPVASSVASPASSEPSVDKAAELTSAMLAKAEAAGEAPAGAPVSEVAGNSAAVTLMWETAKGHLCFAQAPVSGGSDVRLCTDLARISPVAGGHVARAFGTVSAPGGGWTVVLLAERGTRVTSARFAGKAVEWTPVRTLAPERSGRTVYCLTFSRYPAGELVVALDAGGREREERLTLR